MKYTDLSTLKIHKLSKEQYERELAAGNINENEIYLTPDDDGSTDDSVVGTWMLNYDLNLTSNMDVTMCFTSYDADGIKREFNRLTIEVITDDFGAVQDYRLTYYIDGVVYAVCNTLDEMWHSSLSRTITITEEPTDSEFITWLKANAVKQVGTPALKFGVQVESDTTVWDVLSAAQAMGAVLSEWTLINTTGLAQCTVGLQYQPFGSGSFGLLRASNLLDMTCVSNVSDWSTISFLDFTSMFKPLVPTFDTVDESLVGQVLTLQFNGSIIEAVWAPSSNADDDTPSLIGTWTIIDEPEIPTKDLPLEFTSKDQEFMAIGITGMGSSSWGINALSYQAKNGGYYVTAYTNNPSGQYGITHGWSNSGYKTITVTAEPTDPDTIAWLGNNTDAPKIEIKPELPSCDASDEGAFLRVVNGKPAWSLIPFAEDHAF